MIATNQLELESRFDFWNKSFVARVKVYSLPCEIDRQDKENVKQLSSFYSTENYKPDAETLDSHIQYLEGVLVKLLRQRQEEADFFPQNPEVDAEISQIRTLMHKLMEVA